MLSAARRIANPADRGILFHFIKRMQLLFFRVISKENLIGID